MKASPSTPLRGIKVGKLALLAAALTVGIIVWGAWVRVSGSGLGCPDWPLCDGIELTELDRPALIEFGHRIYAGVIIAIVAFAAALAFSNRKMDYLTSWLMCASLIAILLQAGLGLLTVVTELHGLVRLAHLSLAMLILGILTFSSVRNLDIRPSIAPEISDSTIILVIGGLLILIGGGIVGTGISAACLKFPLCGSNIELDTTLMHLAHRVLGVVLVILILRNSIKLRRIKRDKGMVGLMHAVTFILFLQAIVGLLVLEAFNGRFSYHESIRVMHLGLAALIWWGLTAIWALSWKVKRT